MANFSNELKKAMNEKGIAVYHLAISVGITEEAAKSVLRLDSNALYRDVVEVCHVLGLNISIAKLGDK